MDCSIKSIYRRGYELKILNSKTRKVVKDLSLLEYEIIEAFKERYGMQVSDAFIYGGEKILGVTKNGYMYVHKTFQTSVENLEKQLARDATVLQRANEIVQQEDSKILSEKELQEKLDRQIQEDVERDIEEQDSIQRLKEEAENYGYDNIEDYHEAMNFQIEDENEDIWSDTEGDEYYSYLNYKKSLIKKLEDKLLTYKILNKHKKGSVEYNNFVTKTLQNIDTLKEQLSTVKEDNKERTIELIKDEIKEITESLNSATIDDFSDGELLHRLDFLNKAILGKNMQGDVDKSMLWDTTAYSHFDSEIRGPFDDTMRLYYDKREELVKQLIKNTTVWQSNEKYFSDKDKEALFSKIADDLNWFTKNLVGMNGTNDVITASMIKVIFEENEQRAKQNTNVLRENLKKFDAILRKRGVDLDIFHQKDASGVDTGLLTNRFTNSWTKAVNQFYTALTNYIESSPENKDSNYKEVIQWLKDKAEVIDFTRLKYFKDKFGETHSKFFTHSDEEMQEYENKIRELLGKEYDQYIKSIEDKLKEYENFIENQDLDTLITTDKAEKTNSPWHFIKNYYSENAMEGIPFRYDGRTYQTYNLNSNYLTFVPKKTISEYGETKDSGYYDEKFAEIEKDQDLFDYWSTITDLYTNYINPTYSQMGGVSNLSWAKFEQSAFEVLSQASRNRNFFKTLFYQAVDSIKDIWLEHGYETDEKGVKSNYNDRSKFKVNRLKKVLNTKSTKELEKIADKNQVGFQSLKSKVQGLNATNASRVEQKHRQVLIDSIARREVLNGFSKDLTKSTLSLLDLAVTHRARLETSKLIDLVEGFHRDIKTEKGKERTNSNQKLRSYINKKILNQEPSDSSDFKMLSSLSTTKFLLHSDKEYKKLLEGLKEKSEDIEYYSFNTPDGIVVTAQKGTYTMKSEGKEITLSKEDFDELLNTHIETEIGKLGFSFSFASALKGMMGIVAKKSLMLNFISGAFNLIEGKFSNIIADNAGTFWTRGNLRLATNFMMLANTHKISDGKISLRGKQHKLQMDTFIQLLQSLDIIQDRKNVLARNDKESRFNQLSEKLNLMQFAVDNPEFKIQGEAILAMLADIQIKNNKGEVFKFFDGKQFICYEPGTLKLKEEFKIEENMGWKNFTLNDEHKEQNSFFTAYMAMKNAISERQGNYDKNDYLPIFDSILGSTAMMFRRYIPSYFSQRFASRKTDIIQGKIGGNRIGRYSGLLNSLSATGLTTFSLLALNPALGPFNVITLLGTGAVMAGSRFFLRKNLDINEKSKTLAEEAKIGLDFIKQILLQTVDMPMKFMGIKIGLGDTNLGKLLDTVEENKALTKDEMEAIKGTAQGIATILFTLQTMILAHLAFGPDDEDDEDSLKVQFWNMIDNRVGNLLTGWSQFGTIYTLKDELNRMAALSLLEDTAKVLNDVNKFIQGNEVDRAKLGYHIGKMLPLPIPNTVNKAVTKGEFPGFEGNEWSKNDWYDDYLKTDEQKAKKEYKRLRKEYKEAYLEKQRARLEKQNFSEEQIEKRLEKLEKRISRNKSISHNKKKSYQETVDKIKKKLEKIKK